MTRRACLNLTNDGSIASNDASIGSNEKGSNQAEGQLAPPRRHYRLCDPTLTDSLTRLTRQETGRGRVRQGEAG